MSLSMLCSCKYFKKDKNSNHIRIENILDYLKCKTVSRFNTLYHIWLFNYFKLDNT